MAKDEFVWRPYGPYLNARVKRFMDRYGIATWEELISRSVKDIEWFWDAALRDLGVEWFRPYHRVYDTSLGMPWTQWFLGALFFGASVVLYEGTYLYSTPQRIFELIEKYRITIFGLE